MRIGFVVPSGGFAGGIERHAHDLATGLTARGHEVHLFCGDAPGRDPDAYRAPFHATRRMRETTRVDDLDVVYAHRAGSVEELRAFDSVPLLLAAHDHDHTCVRSHRYLPVSHTPCHRPPGRSCVLHGCVLVRDRRPGAPLPVTLRDPFALRRRLRALAARGPFVANSHYVRDRLVDAGVSPTRVHVIHPVPPEAALEVSARPTTRTLLFVGQLLRGKGVDVVIDALPYLPGASLTVVGDGPSRRELMRRAEKVAPGRVVFRGYLPPAEVDACYDAASTVVVPSRWPEPFGMVGVEAFRRGRPVVGADHGGIRDWLRPGAGGELFEPGSARGLARAARRLFGDDDAGGRAHAEAARFSFAAMLDALEALFRVNARGRSRWSIRR